MSDQAYTYSKSQALLYARFMREYARLENLCSGACLSEDATIPPPTMEVLMDAACALEQLAASLDPGVGVPAPESWFDRSADYRADRLRDMRQLRR